MDNSSEMTMDERFDAWEKENEERKKQAEWPAYRPTKKRTVNLSVIGAAIGATVGIIVCIIGWQFLYPVEESMLYPDEASMLLATYSADTTEIGVEEYTAMKASSYYGTAAWDAVNVSENGDGSASITAPDYTSYTALAEAMSSDIDSLIRQASESDRFSTILSGEADTNRENVTLETSVKQGSLTDTSLTNTLLLRMKAYAQFRGRGDQTVSVTYINDGEVIAVFTR